MGTFVTTEPSNVVEWSAEVKGDTVEMFSYGNYGYQYYSLCAASRLTDNSICARIKMYSCKVGNWGALTSVSYRPWGNNGSENEFGDLKSYTYGANFYLAATYYYILPSSYSGSTLTVGMTSGHSSTTANSPVTLTVPKSVGAQCYVNVNGSWKEATMFVNVGGLWKEAQAKINVGGEWK